jgi:hypothetical protein
MESSNNIFLFPQVVCVIESLTFIPLYSTHVTHFHGVSFFILKCKLDFLTLVNASMRLFRKWKLSEMLRIAQGGGNYESCSRWPSLMYFGPMPLFRKNNTNLVFLQRLAGFKPTISYSWDAKLFDLCWYKMCTTKQIIPGKNWNWNKSQFWASFFSLYVPTQVEFSLF